MNNRVTDNSANTFSLFPFLAVLLCTMGALLVLLVVMAQRAGQRTLAEMGEQAVATADYQQPTAPATDTSANEAERLSAELKQVQDYQHRLAELRKQADQQLVDEQSRLSHLEAHTRRLQHELARLELAAQQLQATEENQSVDQQQAERELERQKKLVEEAESRIEELRNQEHGKKSYAIVPYKGPNGTYRKPIYIECRNDGVFIQPEGIQLLESDFLMTSWAGNPLAAALRATREYVNEQAAKSGSPEPADPYPLILVRPDGLSQYNLVRAAITSWDSSFGYEFIDSDWKLEFPDGPDPLLTKQQQHAILLARQRLVQLVQSAPRRFGRSGFSGNSTVNAKVGSQGRGIGGGAEDSVIAQGDSLGTTNEGGQGISNSFANAQNEGTGEGGTNDAATANEVQFGAMAGNAVGGVSGNNTGEAGNSGFADSNGSEETVDAKSTGQLAGGAPGGNAAASNNSFSSSNASGTSGGNSSSGSPGGTSQGRGAVGSENTTASIAKSRGRNWAVQGGSRGSVPIRRTIQVVVRRDQLALLPSRHATDNTNRGHVISLQQSHESISDEFLAALRAHIDEWGLAGSGLYWRPVLQLNVGPDAHQTAQQVIQLLEDSGVELSLPETADRQSGGSTDGRR